MAPSLPPQDASFLDQPLPETGPPLADARRRLAPKRPRKVNPDIAIGMAAAGVPQAKIAKVMGVARHSIEMTIAQTPNARETIADLREKLKLTKMTKAYQLEERMWNRLGQEVDGGDARDVDATARALLAVEKIQAAASGEAHASGAPPPPPPAVDLKILLQQLTAK